MKILIVDDSKFSQITTGKLIRNLRGDMKIFFADNGAEGFQQYKKIKPAYVFVDLLMPKINGQELIQLIKKYDPEAKIFVISADVQTKVRLEVEAYGIKAFINKPFNQAKAQSVLKMIEADGK